jgi:hypothetical protein
VIDALSEVRMLAKDPLRYRRQVLSLKEYAPENCTVMLLDDRSSRYADLELHSIVNGVASMDRLAREYGKTIRRVEVTKLRGCAFREGYHDYIIRKGGVVVFQFEWISAGQFGTGFDCGKDQPRHARARERCRIATSARRARLCRPVDFRHSYAFPSFASAFAGRGQISFRGEMVR